MEVENKEDNEEGPNEKEASPAKQSEVKQEEDELEVDYKQKYRNLKRKLKSLLYEQECFHEELKKIQRKCLRVSRDKSFLMDRLLQYEHPDESTDDELTSSASSTDEDDEIYQKKKKDVKSKVQDAKKVKAAPKNNQKTADKSRCKHVDKGKQCSKLVSKKIKSGICQTHRQANAKQEKVEKEESDCKEKPTKSQSTTPSRKPPTGGKDIGQIREAMEASSKLGRSSSENEDEDDLVIDLPH